MKTCEWIIFDGSEFSDSPDYCGKPCEGKNALCASHARIARKIVTDAEKQAEKISITLQRSKIKNATPRPKVNKVSSKRKVENKLYSELREQFLKDNPECQAGLEGCDKESTDVHHMIGRGKELNNVKYWLSVCRSCHVFITENPLEAIRKNLSFSRLEKREC